MYERRGLRTGSETPRLNSFALVAWWFFLSTQRASRPCGAMSKQLLLKPYDNVLNYSHSFTLVCCGAIPIGPSLVVGFVRLATESLRVSSRRRLGQALGQIRKLFRNREPAVSFLSRGQKRVGFEALKRPRWMIKRLIFLFGVCLAK